ncbi:CheR family methyltransferase [Frigidibacter oleivorans]|uniref:CheR family methyltransferase n=1 Tax=Frigidibacter oleivorans TaxID=2487129 RepID=UPI000F8C8757|nr:protein-glutamate O-methyltransferase CheR [Frigidibacter oleivorans]
MIDQRAESSGYETIRDWLSRRCAIHYPEAKRDLLTQRLGRVQRAYAIPSLAALAAAVGDSQQHEVQLAVIHAASTNHTYFWREHEVLEFFRASVLPDLARRPQIRLWSAACSTGDEVYTLAILIAETLGMAALEQTQILGTDISEPVISRAESGIFPARQLQSMPAALRAKYLVPVGIEQFQVIPALRRACTFRRMNLKVTPFPFRNTFQAAFCRNVLYYFAHEDQVATVNAIADVVEPGGWLFTSVTENVRDMSHRWKVLDSGIARRAERS